MAENDDDIKTQEDDYHNDDDNGSNGSNSNESTVSELSSASVSQPQKVRLIVSLWFHSQDDSLDSRMLTCLHRRRSRSKSKNRPR